MLTSTSGNHSGDCIVQLERTLDEAYYPGLEAEDFEVRNKDQVISRKFRKDATLDENIPILMVPQLWLWRIGEIIVSAYSMTQPSDLFSLGNYKGARIQPKVCKFGSDMQLGLIIADQIKQFGKGREVKGAKFPPPLDIFETSITSVLSEVNNYMKVTKPSQIDYLKEREFLHGLSDITSELAMIQDVLKQQMGVLKDLLNDYSESKMAMKDDICAETEPSIIEGPPPLVFRDPASLWVEIERAQNTLAQYQKRAKKIDRDVQRVEKTVQDQLNLKRTYASIKDAHSSLLLSTAVIGFTVITIIFAHLSFLTALFALNIDGFDKLKIPTSNQIDVYDSRKMGAILGRRSLSISALRERC